jgi:hypothetical protein
MQDLEKKLIQLKDLIKAIRQTQAMPMVKGPSLPKLPEHKPIQAPSMTPSKGAAPKISSGEGPSSKKDPKKVAQQIKDGSMSTKTQKVMLKADSVTGQWYLEPTTPSSI